MRGGLSVSGGGFLVGQSLLTRVKFRLLLLETALIFSLTFGGETLLNLTLDLRVAFGFAHRLLAGHGEHEGGGNN